mmetsp:Transcript_1200/g.1242  ORF Transcript_1200/g.1242 Transcript_1200/m.1242 type:complete len:139 (+) Transcript_1200:434-850(+)
MYQYRRLKGFQISIGERFFLSREFKMMILTNLISLLHPIPGYDKLFIFNGMGIPTRYSLNTLLTALMLLRVYLVIRLFPSLSKWTDAKSEKICEKEGFEAGFGFALKVLLRQRPYLMLFMNFLVSLVIFGFAVRLFER